MKVYIVISIWMGDGARIEGVFGTNERAEDYIKQSKVSIEYLIEEYVVQF